MNGIDLETITLPNGFSFQMIEVPGGTFTQGPRAVTLSDFQLARYPVTQALWERVMGEGSNPSRFEGPRRPVERVSWFDAVAFCNLLNKLENLPFCYFSDEKYTQPYALEGELPNEGPVYYQPTPGAFHLPTEAEWEYAARGGPFHTKTEYTGSDRVKDVAWYNDNSGSETHPVGLLQPNMLGLHDMSGNVWEWCWDWFADFSSKTQTNTTKSPNNKPRRVCGGSWVSNHEQILNLNYRGYFEATDRADFIGFRLARR